METPLAGFFVCKLKKVSNAALTHSKGNDTDGDDEDGGDKAAPPLLAAKPGTNVKDASGLAALPVNKKRQDKRQAGSARQEANVLADAQVTADTVVRQRGLPRLKPAGAVAEQRPSAGGPKGISLSMSSCESRQFLPSLFEFDFPEAHLPCLITRYVILLAFVTKVEALTRLQRCQLSAINCCFHTLSARASTHAPSAGTKA